MGKFCLLASLALLVILAQLTASCGPDLKSLEALKNPKISPKPPQKMLVMEVKGDPNGQTGGVGALFNVYFKLQFKDKKMVAPRARWPMPFNTPRDKWVGIWAMPVGDEVTSLPADAPASMRLETWEYGMVAEILHVGPYSKELPAIERLHRFIQESGYEIIAPHEEEYIVGPGMFGPGDPEKYYTIIRYTVRQATNRGK